MYSVCATAAGTYMEGYLVTVQHFFATWSNRNAHRQAEMMICVCIIEVGPKVSQQHVTSGTPNRA